VSFGTYARHVRNPELPYRRRVSALRSCVQLYRPIGFHATLSFLEEIAGPFQRDEMALLRALDALVASRAAWHAEQRDYATYGRWPSAGASEVLVRPTRIPVTFLSAGTARPGRLLCMLCGTGVAVRHLRCW
jgi:hypothetical protein